MKNMLIIGIVVVSVLLNGCESKGSKEYFKNHKDEMQAKIKRCTNKDLSYQETEECKNALEANGGINPYDDEPMPW